MAELNDKLRFRDKFDLKYRLFVATILLFNTSAASIYWLIQGSALSKFKRGLIVLSIVPLLHFQFNIHWMNAEFCKAFENSQSS